MEKLVIARGAAAGVIAGVLAFIFGRVFAEPVISRAIERQDAADAAHAASMPGMDMGETEVFSRTVQQNFGLTVGIIVFGLLMGALFAVAYCVAAPKVPRWTPRALAAAVAASLFTGFYLLPSLKYPPNPPGVGDPATIGERTGTYLLMVAISLGLIAAAWAVAIAVAPRLPGWAPAYIGGAIVVVGFAIAYLVLPSPLPAGDFPADDLYSFRVLSLIAQVIVWGAIDLIGGELIHRLTVAKGAPTTTIRQAV